VTAAAGFAMFVLPAADAGSYWTSFFPAVMVMSLGMTVSVAPLTTTVMGAVEERHAGIASGINNAVSRTAALLAVAVFGVVMLGTFKGDLGEHLSKSPLPQETREQILAQSGDLAETKVPVGLSDEEHAAVSGAITQSFVSGFRVVAYIAAILGILSAIASWVLIEGKPKRGV
jgi:hypothetical protein